MKTFIIINGKSVRTINAENMEQAITRAENTCDHSKEVIVREIETLNEDRKVIVKVKGGIAFVDEISPLTTVEIHDYDIEMAGNRTLETDTFGGQFIKSTFQN